MMKNLYYCFGIITFLLPFCGAGGTISYPALGNIYMQEGTIEMWLIPQVDLMAKNMFSKIYWRHPLFMMEQKGLSFQLAWLVRKGRSCPVALHVVEKAGLNHYLPVKKWDNKQPRHIAYCWKAGVDWWIIDGKKLPKKQHREWHRVPIDGQLRIVLGSERFQGFFVVDDLRISSVARRVNEVGFHYPGKLKLDQWTLLLDNFDKPFQCNGIHRTATQAMTPASDGKPGGIPDNNCKFVPSINGTGICL